MDLPSISAEPRRLPGLCLSISTRLLETLRLAIPQRKGADVAVLSIGCGSGLLESYFSRYVNEKASASDGGSPSEGGNTLEGGSTSDVTVSKKVLVLGVEVLSAASSTANGGLTYLPVEDVRLVKGTWQICDEAVGADVWMWVYPRDPRLLSSYLERFDLLVPPAKRESSAENGVETGIQNSRQPASRVKCVVWLGPRIDWPDYEKVLRASLFGDSITTQVGSAAGLSEEEMLATALRE